MPTKIGWKSYKIYEKSREFINHFRDFLCFNGFMPENAIFRGRWCLRECTILDLGVRCRPPRGLFSPKKFWFCNELQRGEMECNEPHLTQAKRILLSILKASFIGRRSHSHLFLQKKSLILKPSYQSPSTLSMNWQLNHSLNTIKLWHKNH